MPIFCVDMTEKQVSYVEVGLRKNLTEFFERLADVTEIDPDWLEEKLGKGFQLRKTEPRTHERALRNNMRYERVYKKNQLCLIAPVAQDKSGRFWEWT